jgi:hypothetical protein
MASLIGARPAIWTGGLACVVAVLGSVGLRGFIRYDDRLRPNG